MILTTSIGTEVVDIGDEIWQISLEDALREEAEKTAYHLPASLLDHVGYHQLVDLMRQDMSEHLRAAGDSYTAIDGVIYTLSTPLPGASSLPVMAQAVALEATFHEVPYGARAATVRWSDGSTSEAIRFYPDEILICEGDLIGKTQDQIRSLHHHRDRDWLQS